MLEVHPGKDTREPLTQDLFLQFRDLLQAKVTANLRTDNMVRLNISFTQWSQHKHAGLIACKDDVTQAWILRQVESIVTADGTTFRAWFPEDMSRFRPARITVGDLGIPLGDLVDLIKGYNGDLQGEIVLLQPSKLVLSRKGAHQALLGFDDLAAASLILKKDPLRVSLGLNQRHVQYSGLSSLIKRLGRSGKEDLARRLALRSKDPLVVAALAAAGADVEEETAEDALANATDVSGQ